MRTPIGILSGILVVGLLASAVQGMYAHYYPQERIDRSDLVVVGELSDVKDRYITIAIGESPEFKTIYDTGEIKVLKILKGSIPEKEPVRIMFMDSNQMFMNSDGTFSGTPCTSEAYTGGEKGVWFLQKSLGIYYQPLNNLCRQPGVQTLDEIIQKCP